MPYRALLFVRPLVFVLVFVSGLVVAWSGVLPNPISKEPAGVDHAFRPFWETWRLVQEEYVDRSAVDPQRMTDGAISGLLASLGDTGHTVYLPRDEAERMAQDLSGHLEGIGVRLGMRQGQPVIVAVLPDTPAQKAGVKAGDVLLQAGGKDLKDKSPQQIVQLLVGKAGTELHLTVSRAGEAEPIQLTITRARIDIPYVSWHMLQDRPIAHVAISQFGDGADAQLKTALKEAQDQGAHGLVLDIRDNGGGLEKEAVAVTSEFLKDGNVYIQQDAKGRQTPKPVLPGGIATDIPLVVLIDEGTASSSEIFAGAIQDHKRGQLVGTKTFGTGTVLQAYTLTDGSAVLLAVAEWLTPNGRRIWHQGIIPDVAVALPAGATLLSPDESGRLSVADLDKSTDKQLVKALEVLAAQLK